MKFGRKIKLIIEQISLCTLQLDLTLILVANHCREENSALYMNKLYKGMKGSLELKSIVDWVHQNTPLTFSSKKKKFVINNTSKWSELNKLKEVIFLSKDSHHDYHFSELAEVPKILDRVNKKVNSIELKINASTEIISDSEIQLVESESTQEKIRAYLASNPAPSIVGKFGVPQSKYRNGTYGLHSMEYNGWSR